MGIGSVGFSDAAYFNNDIDGNNHVYQSQQPTNMGSKQQFAMTVRGWEMSRSIREMYSAEPDVLLAGSRSWNMQLEL